jgi:hypothetical protein
VSQATLDLLASADVLIGVAVGSLAVLALIGWVALKHRPLGNGGLVMAGSIVIALVVTNRVPVWMVAGLVLMAAAGWIPANSAATRMLTLIPGAALIAVSFTDSPQTALGGFVVVVIVLAGPLVADFDERYRESVIATPLMAVSLLGVFVTIPDTDVAVVAAAAAAPWVFAGPPARLAVLGRSGSYAATALMVWVVASGGFSRSGSLVTGAAALGLLVAEPVVRRIRSADHTRLGRVLSAGVAGAVAIVVVQGAIGLILGQVIGGSALGAAYASVLAVSVLVIAGVWAGAVKQEA